MTSPDPTLRVDPMRESDLDEVVAIEAASFHRPAPAGTSADAPLPALARMREELSRAWTKMWVARGDGAHVQGFLLAWHVVDELHVLDVATHPAHRRRGVGRALLGRAIAYAAESKVRLVLLEVRRGNAPAIGLYRGFGFAAMALRRDYYPDHEDAIEMVLTLDPDTGAIVPQVDDVRLDG